MARRHDVLGVTGADTVIGTGVKLKGTLNCDGDIAIDGHVIGNVQATGNVSIGINATLKSNIEAVDVVVNGTLSGNIMAEGKVDLGETAHLVGNITCQSIAIASGAVFVGQIQMTEDQMVDPNHDIASAEVDNSETSES